ncbi:MAG: hypothetical protein LBG19_05995 [Prevotellaceae bacterium]|jgi:hypothetical protein|nr:hypothetical protein [Prevotellaceae bacterium]
MKKVEFVSPRGLSVLSKEEQKKISGGYWDNSGQCCDAKPCDDLGIPVICRPKEGDNVSYCYYWIE